jgi:hypothetical protein
MAIFAIILDAFLNCSPNWVKGWFPVDDEIGELQKSKPLSVNETYVLRYDDNDELRHGVVVQKDWWKDGYLTDEDSYFIKDRKDVAW